MKTLNNDYISKRKSIFNIGLLFLIFSLICSTTGLADESNFNLGDSETCSGQIEEEAKLFQENTIIAKDDKKLHYKYYKGSKKKKVIIISHGLLDHSGRWHEFSKHFQSEGYSVYIQDLRGHGKSEGKKGDIKNFDQYVIALSF
jgi:hypothetical protein